MGIKGSYKRQCLLLLLLSCFSGIGQTIKGKILNEEHKPIVNASVQLKSADESLVYAFVVTNSNGDFEIQHKINQNKAILKISYIGYETLQKEIAGTPEGTDLGVIVLRKNIELLKEVTVKAEALGIEQKGDTTFYKINRFLNGTEENLKDVIDKLPGLNINDKGKITANGKTIDKLLIDGEDLYKNQHRFATDNLPSKIINSVELIQNYVGFGDVNKEEKTGKTALNVTIKEEYKNKVTGYAEGGKGFDRQYRLKNVILNFNEKAQFSTITNFNNIAENPISVEDYFDLVQEKSDDKESKVVFSNLEEIPGFLTTKDRVATKESAFNTTSLIYNVNKKAKLDVYSLINNAKQTLDVSKEQEFYSSNTNFRIIENKKNYDENTFGLMNARFIYKENDQSVHKIKTGFLFEKTDKIYQIENLTDGNPKNIVENHNLKNTSFTVDYNVSKKITNLFFDYRAFYKNTFSRTDLNIVSNDNYLNPNYLNSDKSLDQYTNAGKNGLGSDVSLQLKKNKFVFTLSNNTVFEKSGLKSVLNTVDNNDLKLNRFSNTLTFNTKYQINSTFDVSVAPDFIYNRITFDENSKNVTYAGYKVNLKAKFSSTNILQISASRSNSNPVVENLLENDIVKDYRTVVNNDNVKVTTVLPSMQYNINYFSFDVKNRFSLILNLLHKENKRAMDNTIITTNDIVYLNNSIISNEKFSSAMLFFEKEPKNIPVSFLLSASYTNLSKSILNNNAVVDFESNLFSGMCEVKSRYKNFPVFFNAGVRLSDDNYGYNEAKSHLISYQLYSKCNGNVFKNIFWTVNADYFVFKNTRFESSYLNLSPIIRFAKEKSRLEYAVIGSNILNLNNTTAIENYSNSNYSELIRKPVLGGYVLVQVKFKF